jgi:hypothetical protein
MRSDGRVSTPAHVEHKAVEKKSRVESGGRPWQSGRKVNDPPALEDYMCFAENGCGGQEARTCIS